MTSNVVFIVDDDDSVRDSLAALLRSENYVVKAFASARAFLDVLEEKPGCAVLDIRMPEMDGLELQSELARRGVKLPIIFVTGHGDVPLAVRAMQAGAVDFIEKPYDSETLLKSIRHALELEKKQRIEVDSMQQSVERIASLTSRERDVLEQLVSGHPNKIIAHHLGISPRTVEIYRANVMEKMAARSLSDLVRAALVAGLGAKTK